MLSVQIKIFFFFNQNGILADLFCRFYFLIYQHILALFSYEPLPFSLMFSAAIVDSACINDPPLIDPGFYYFLYFCYFQKRFKESPVQTSFCKRVSRSIGEMLGQSFVHLNLWWTGSGCSPTGCPQCKLSPTVGDPSRERDLKEPRNSSPLVGIPGAYGDVII